MNQVLIFLKTNWEWLAATASALAAIVGVYYARKGTLKSPPEAVPATTQAMTESPAGVQVVETGGDVSINVGTGNDLDAAALVQNLLDRLERKPAAEGVAPELSARLDAQSDQNQQLIEMVQALVREKGDPAGPAGIDVALQHLNEGRTAEAEKAFREIKDRKKAEGAAANREAAAAARHLGALAFLHDTDAALAAYREAADLDPDDSDGWNQMGRLLKRIGDLSGAEMAYRKVLALGNQTKSRETIAVATGNLGLIALTRGDLDTAWDLLNTSLDINKELGRKGGDGFGLRQFRANRADAG